MSKLESFGRDGVKRSFKSMTLIMLVLNLFVFGCAKERDAELSDTQKRHLISIDEIKKNDSFSVALKTPSGGDNLIQGENELIVDDSTVPSVFKGAFIDYKMGVTSKNREAISAKIPLFFELTSNDRLTAYKVVKEEQMSIEDKANSVRKDNGDYNVRMFYYPVRFIKLEVIKDSNGEPTNNYEEVSVVFNEATHIALNFNSTDKVRSGFFSQDQKKSLKLKSDLEKFKEFYIETGDKADENLATGDKLSEVKVKVGLVPNIFKKVFEEKVIEGEPNKRIKIVTDLTRDGKMSFYKNISSDEYKLLSGFEKELAKKQIDGTFNVKLLDYNVKFYNLRNEKNDDGELTSRLEKVNSTLDNATFIDIDFESVKGEKPSIVKRNPEIILKTKIDTELEYLYVPSTHGVPRRISAGKPFVPGTPKIVRVKFTENFLEVYQPDETYDNELNQRPIFSIPIEHKDFRCVTRNRHGCVKEEEVGPRVSWTNKRYFLPRFEGLDVKERNELDYFGDVTGNGCYAASGQSLVDKEIAHGVLNVFVKRTLEVTNVNACVLNGARTLDAFQRALESKSTFEMKYMYSLVSLKQLESGDYKSVDYPEFDRKKFGFFKRTVGKYNKNLEPGHPDEHTYIARWNPNIKGGVLKYYISDTFYKKDNARYLKALDSAVENANNALARANIKFRIKYFPKGDRKIIAGDLRYNVINLIDEPLAAGLLGHAPMIIHPRTGEIVNGRVNIYTAPMVQSARKTYKEVALAHKKELDLKNFKEAEKVRKEGTIAALWSKWFGSEDKVEKRTLEHPPALHGTLMSGNAMSRGIASVGKTKEVPRVDSLKIKNAQIENSKSLGTISKKIQDVFLGKVKNIKPMIEGETLASLKLEIERNEKIEETKRFLEKNQMMLEPAEGTKINLALDSVFKIKEVRGVEDDQGYLKNWDNLTEDQKQEVTNIVSVSGFTSTFTHELGHNLGLRHNFNGSVDEENFYTKDEANRLGMRFGDRFSSIMDYGFNFLNELPVYGKYDVAALRFGYAREAEFKNKDDKDGKKEFLLSFNNKTLKQYIDETKVQNLVELKNYKYCTDEDVPFFADCNRFDEGKDFSELADHYIAKYEDSYKEYNFKTYDGFSYHNLGWYLGTRMGDFKQLREIYDMYLIYKSIVSDEIWNACLVRDVEKGNGLYESCKIIKSVNEAGVKVGDFFLKIMKMPDHKCFVRKISNHRSTESVKFKDLYEKVAEGSNDEFFKRHMPATCFNKNIQDYIRKNAEKEVYAEVGKIIDDVRDKAAYDYAKLLARSSWPDRMIALMYSSNRVQSNLIVSGADGGTVDALTAGEYFSNKFNNLMDSVIMGDTLRDPVMATNQFNQPAIGLDLKGNEIDVTESANPYQVASGIGKWGEGYGDFYLYKHMIALMVYISDLNKDPNSSNAASFGSKFKVIRKNKLRGHYIDNKDVKTLGHDNYIYGVVEKGSYADRILESQNIMTSLIPALVKDDNEKFTLADIVYRIKKNNESLRTAFKPGAVFEYLKSIGKENIAMIISAVNAKEKDKENDTDLFEEIYVAQDMRGQALLNKLTDFMKNRNFKNYLPILKIYNNSIKEIIDYDEFKLSRGVYGNFSSLPISSIELAFKLKVDENNDEKNKLLYSKLLDYVNTIASESDEPDLIKSQAKKAYTMSIKLVSDAKKYRENYKNSKEKKKYSFVEFLKLKNKRSEVPLLSTDILEKVIELRDKQVKYVKSYVKQLISDGIILVQDVRFFAKVFYGDFANGGDTEAEIKFMRKVIDFRKDYARLIKKSGEPFKVRNFVDYVNDVSSSLNSSDMVKVLINLSIVSIEHLEEILKMKVDLHAVNSHRFMWPKISLLLKKHGYLTEKSNTEENQARQLFNLDIEKIEYVLKVRKEYDGLPIISDKYSDFSEYLEFFKYSYGELAYGLYPQTNGAFLVRLLKGLDFLVPYRY